MKSKINILIFLALFSLLNLQTYSQLSDQINPDLLRNYWDAKWITYPNDSGKEFGIYLFRKSFSLDSISQKFVIHISADNRYKLYVNEQYVCNGPSRGDLLNWRFESIDIAPFLKKGKNIISAVVWNFAELRPLAQFSLRTGFILQSDKKADSIANTNKSWRVFKDTAYCYPAYLYPKCWRIGPGEKFIAEFHPWDWKSAEYDDNLWMQSKEIDAGIPLKGIKETGRVPRYILSPRNIPFMEEKKQFFGKIRRADLQNIPEQFVSGDKNLIIPANSKVTILFDQNYLTNAYPVLNFSKGKDSEIKLTYAESLFDENGNKGNRNVVDGKEIVGNCDIVIADGGENRTYQTLWLRTFRYVEMQVTTQKEPLIINNFHSIFTGYPLEEKATFKCDDPLFTDIWNVGWRTQRLCAGETFYDCPYYEQLQYVGDTRIQSLITMYVSGDTALVRNAIASFNDSRLPFGLTQSRYPSYQQQVIPTFSLIWINMIYDYWMHCGDKKFVKSMLPGMIGVLQWYESKLDSTGMLSGMEWWNFADWATAKDWVEGTPPGGYLKTSAMISLQFAYTLRLIAPVFNALDREELSAYYASLSEKTKKAVFAKCWDENKQLIADTPDKKHFSQHTNIWAILVDLYPIEKQKEILTRLLNDKELTQCTYYFKFYLTQALKKVGLAEQYTDMLDPWKEMLNNGLTTFVESPEPVRSDCHAWSASPVYYFLSLVCGIVPNEPGFNSVKIEPNLGKLNWIEGTMPHRLGDIKLSLKKGKDGHVAGSVNLPKKLTGVFIWGGKSIALKSGVNNINL